ncbi:MAG: AAA family ATPase [Anaerolineae bacterium]|nr:AAA family ATPase [Anaerolineae bacterium]
MESLLEVSLHDAPDTVFSYWLGRLLYYQPSLLIYLRDLLDAVVAHVPRIVAQTVLNTPDTGLLGLPLEGTVMFADIDGFTPLAERFSQIASDEGTEELTDLVNRFLELLIPITARYGGDLQKFGGDAGMLLFRGEDHAMRAVAASLELQQAMRAQMGQVETSVGTFPLRIAIGLGSGRMVGFGLGNQTGREWLLVGPPLVSMGEAQMIAPPEGIVMDAATLAACQEYMECKPLDNNLYLVVGMQTLPPPFRSTSLPAPPRVEDVERVQWLLSRLDALTPYLAPGLLPRLVAAPTLDRTRQWSDRRQVTIMMISLDKIPDPMPYWEDAAGLKQFAAEPNALFMQIRDTVLRYDGIVNKIGSSPKGAYVMVLFGAPRAHEDDPLRAVLAALELQETLPVPLQFGINAGYVFAGDTGTYVRREYTVMGDEVNLAARLMVACPPGEIWLGPNASHHPSVSRRVMGDFEPPQHFKGKRDPIAPFVARGLRRVYLGAVETEIPLVGREAELAQISQHIHKAKAGQASMALVHGGAGVGKSRLIREIVHLAEQEGFAVHTGSAPSYGEHLPFAAWDEVLLSLLELEKVASEERSAALLTMLLRYGLDTWAALIGPLVGVEVQPSRDVLALAPAMRDARRAAILQMLWQQAALECPRLLILENAQWMSEASLSLLNGLIQAEGAASLLVLITYRDDARFALAESARADVLDVPLGPLDGVAIKQLVDNFLENAVVPQEVESWIVARSGGLPLFATEAVRALVNSGVLQRCDGAWAMTTSLDDFPLPDMVFGLIQSRIDQLSPPTRHLLRAAAVVGDEMSIGTLAAAYGEESETVVRRRLAELSPFGLVYRDRQSEILSFRQPLVREVAYRGLPHRVRRFIHRRLVEYLDLHREQATPNWLTLLAYHTFEGQLWEKAIQVNLELGKQALRSYLANQALQALERVLLAADTGGLAVPEARFEAHHLLGDTQISLGQYALALEHLRQAREMLPLEPTATEDVARMADLEYHEATALEAQAEYDAALVVVERGLDLPGVGQMLEGARLYLLGADLYRRRNNFTQANTWAQRSIALTARLPGPEAQQLRSRAMYMMALLASLRRLGNSG